MDVRDVRSMGGVEGAVWGATEVMGARWGVAKVGEAGDEGIVQGLVVEPLRLTVRPPTSIRGGGGWSDRPGSRSNR
jgi:hypothetical protein